MFEGWKMQWDEDLVIGDPLVINIQSEHLRALKLLSEVLQSLAPTGDISKLLPRSRLQIPRAAVEVAFGDGLRAHASMSQLLVNAECISGHRVDLELGANEKG